MVALSNLNTSTGGLAIGDWLYSAKPLAAPEYLPLNNDEASYLTSSYPTLGATYAPTAISYATTTTTIPINAAAYNFSFGNETYLGWTTTGNVITSSDCVTWSRSAIDTNYAVKPSGTYSGGSQQNSPIYAFGGWLSMAYGNGRFVAIRPAPLYHAWSGSTWDTPSIGGTAVSTDNGLTWTQGTISQPYVSGAALTDLGTSWNWKAIGFGNGYFIAYGIIRATATTNWILVSSYSSDGVTWSPPTGNNLGFSATYLFINIAPTLVYGNGVFVGVSNAQSGYGGTGDNFVVYSSGAATSGWNYALMPTTQWWRSVAFGNGVFVAVGSATSTGSAIACTSTNGTSWTNRTMPATLDWTSVTFANGYFVAVGTDHAGTSLINNIATSTDGITWTLRASTSAGNRGPIAGGNGRFIYQDNAGFSLVASSRASVISLSAAASTFTLPIIPPLPGTQTYMKAT